MGLVLAFFTLWMIIFGGLVNSTLESCLPKIVSDAFRYGKTLSSNMDGEVVGHVGYKAAEK